jgi:hypothetical protein
MCSDDQKDVGSTSLARHNSSTRRIYPDHLPGRATSTWLKRPAVLPPARSRRSKRLRGPEQFMRAIIQKTQAWQLAASVKPIAQGYHLMVTSFVPTARRPEEHVRFQGTFTEPELRQLRDLLDQAVQE